MISENQGSNQVSKAVAIESTITCALEAITKLEDMVDIFESGINPTQKPISSTDAPARAIGNLVNTMPEILTEIKTRITEVTIKLQALFG